MSIPATSDNILHQRTVLLACSAKLMKELQAGIEQLGGIPVHFPVIEAEEIEDKRPLDKSIAALQQYAWIIFTSAYGVAFFAKRLAELGLSKDALPMPKICAIGPATAAASSECGFPPALVAEKFVAEGVIEILEHYHGGLKNLAGLRFLIPRAKEAREFLPEALASAGGFVDTVPCYRTVRSKINEEVLKRIQEKIPDLAVFTSASAIRNMVETLGPEAAGHLLQEATVVVIGPITAKAAESQGKRPEIIPEKSTVPGMLAAIRQHFAGK